MSSQLIFRLPHESYFRNKEEMEQFAPALVDVKKLLEYSSYNEQFHIGEDDLPDSFIREMDARLNTTNEIRMPIIGVFQNDRGIDQVGFFDGRHTKAYLASVRIKQIPVLIPKECINPLVQMGIVEKLINQDEFIIPAPSIYPRIQSP